jgi:archaellum biogenesis ATPase FlaH
MTNPLPNRLTPAYDMTLGDVLHPGQPCSGDDYKTSVDKRFKPGAWVLHATRGLGEVTRAPQDKIALEVRFEGAAAGERVLRNLIQPADAPRAKELDHWQRLIQMQQLPADAPYSPSKAKEGYYGKALKRAISRPHDAAPVGADPSRSEALKLGFTELLEQALLAIRTKDLDTEMELRAEMMGRFKRSDTQITAALFRLLTEQETGKPAGSTITTEALDLDSIEGLDALLDGFIPANDLGLMYGAKGSGKTLAALAMGFAAIDGTGFLDHSKPAQQGPVLFIASDSGAPPLMAAMQDLGVADHPAIRGADRSFYVWAHSASQGMSSWCASINGCVQLLQFVKAKGIRLVLIDSAKTICAKAGISYLDNDSIAALLTFIKEAICPHTSVMILSHDGTEKGSHSGAKVWAEVPSIVHNIQQIPDAPQERLWRVVKNRMGSLRELRYQVGEGGHLEVCAGVETIQDATAAVLQVLSEATAKGISSMSRAGLVQEIQQRFRLAPKTIDNTLVRMVRAISPEICRVSSKRGHYKLSPRLAATISPNSVSPKGKEQGKNLVSESDLLSSRGVGSGNSREVKSEFPPSSQFPGVGKSINTSAGEGFDPFTAREVEMGIGGTDLVELFCKGQRVEALDPQTRQWGNGFTVLADTAEGTVKVQTPTGRTAHRRRDQLRVA